MRNILIIVFFTFFNKVSAQDSSIYFFKNRYNQNTLQKIEQSRLDFKEIKILLGYMIDPKRQEVADYKRVKKSLETLFPNANQEGVLCIDWENKLYQNIRGNNITRIKSVSNKEYLKGEKEFINLIKFIKKLRPNVKVGIFEMPFRVYSNSEIIKNTNQKLDPILKHVDIIFPCIYIPFPAKVKSIQSNYDFLKINLDLAFNYGDRLKKPVIPFVWYLYYSPDNTYRKELIPKDELWEYIKYIESYKSSSNKRVSGIVWWDTPTSYSKTLIRNTFIDDYNKKDQTINDVFSYYFDL